MTNLFICEQINSVLRAKISLNSSENNVQFAFLFLHTVVE